MDSKKLTGFVVILGIVLMLFIGLCALCSCTTKSKVITEYVNVHDTVQIHHTDTIHKTNIVKEIVHDTTTVAVHDTIIHESGQIIVLNELGDTIKEKTWENQWQKIQEQLQTNHSETMADSTDYYHARSDSLQQALHEAQQKEKVVVKKASLPWWVWVFIALNIPTLLYIIVRKVKSRHHE